MTFRNSALGVWRRIAVGPLTGTIYLPRPNLEGAVEELFSVNLLPPRLKDIDFAIRVESDDNRVSWGRYFSYNKNDLAGTALATVGAAVLAIPAKQVDREWSLEEVAKACISDFPGWCRSLTDWIEVLTGNDLNTAHSVDETLDPSRWTSAAWIKSTPGSADYEYVNPAINIYDHDENPMYSTHWSAAIRAANAGRQLPDIWALLRDARSAQRRRQYRRAILDAATAAELIVDQELRNRLLKANSIPFVDKLLKNTWQVSRRMDLMAAQGMWLPTGIRKDLTDLRNQVIHKNIVASPREAQTALDVAYNFANHYVGLR